jgi:hypothetical protein
MTGRERCSLALFADIACRTWDNYERLITSPLNARDFRRGIFLAESFRLKQTDNRCLLFILLILHYRRNLVLLRGAFRLLALALAPEDRDKVGG